MKIKPIESFKKTHIYRATIGQIQVETRPDKGQGLVEFALVLPILLLLLLGVFEVGWALRSYIVLANVNREATRFAARGIYLDLDQKNDPMAVGYDKVVSHTLDSLATQLELDLFGGTPNTAMIVTYYNIEPFNFNCEGDTRCAGFDCSRFAYENRDQADFVAGESLNKIEYPWLTDTINDPQNPPPDFYGQVLTIANTTAITAYHFHQGAPFFSRINPADKVVELRSQNNVHNCQLAQKDLPPTNNDVIIVEDIFLQHQLVGLPFVTAFVPDPFPLYTHTAMRVASDIRETATPTTTTDCPLKPIIIPASKVGAIHQGETISVTIENSPDVPGNFGYLDWNLANHASGELEEALLDSSKTDEFKEPETHPSDTTINIGDWVEANPGEHAEVTPELDALIAADDLIIVPIWDDSDCLVSGGGTCTNAQSGGSPESKKFKIFTFAVLKVKNYIYGSGDDCDSVKSGNQKCLVFEFSHFDPNVCSCETSDPFCDKP